MTEITIKLGIDAVSALEIGKQLKHIKIPVIHNFGCSGADGSLDTEVLALRGENTNWGRGNVKCPNLVYSHDPLDDDVVNRYFCVKNGLDNYGTMIGGPKNRREIKNEENFHGICPYTNNQI